MQLSFDFAETRKELTDKDGDILVFNVFTDKVKTIAHFLKCSVCKAREVLAELEKEYDVYTCGTFQIVLAKDSRIIYNFEIGGETWYQTHKYNTVNEWQFRKLVEGIKPKEKRPPKQKKITLMITERQQMKARQLFYAHSIGFDINYRDYQKWHLL